MNQHSTLAWFKALLGDDQKLQAWLYKLWHTEYSGGAEHVAFIEKFKSSLTEREIKIYQNIAADEFRHADMIEVILIEQYGFDPKTTDVPIVESEYWKEMLRPLTQSELAEYSDQVGVFTVAPAPKHLYAAANFFGEQAAAERFKIMLEADFCPQHLKEFLEVVLPEETFHRETLKRLATPVALQLMQSRNQKALGKLTKRS